jgi:hypothetical protein
MTDSLRKKNIEEEHLSKVIYNVGEVERQSNASIFYEALCYSVKCTIPLAVSAAVGVGVIFASSKLSINILQRTLAVVRQNVPRN